MEEEVWFNAVVASDAHIRRFHPGGHDVISNHAGQIIRVRPDDEATKRLKYVVGCCSQFVTVHPQDAIRLWPDAQAEFTLVALCGHDYLIE